MFRVLGDRQDSISAGRQAGWLANTSGTEEANEKFIMNGLKTLQSQQSHVMAGIRLIVLSPQSDPGSVGEGAEKQTTGQQKQIPGETELVHPCLARPFFFPFRQLPSVVLSAVLLVRHRWMTCKLIIILNEAHQGNTESCRSHLEAIRNPHLIPRLAAQHFGPLSAESGRRYNVFSPKSENGRQSGPMTGGLYSVGNLE